MHRFYSFVLFMMFAFSAIQAQDKEPLPTQSPSEVYTSKSIVRHDFDEKKWESLKKGIDYSTPKKKETEKTKKKEPAKEAPSGDNSLASVLKILAIVIGVGLLVLLIVNMAGGENLFGPKNSKLKPAVSASELEKIEENLHEAQLEDPIQRAVAAGDYPMAVRLYYLSVLKELAVRNHIRWKRDKTNGAYLRELAGSPLFATMQEVTLIFERIWYGKVELTNADFKQLEIKLKKAVATASA